MSFSSLLNQVKHKSCSPDRGSSPSPAPPSKKPSTAASDLASLPINAVPKGYRRPATVDPAVARLKEARRLQKEKEEALRKKKNPTRTTKSGGTTKAAASANLVRRKQQEREQKMKDLENAVYRPRSQSPVKKLTYSELMAQAKQKGKALSEAPKSPPPQDTQKDRAPGYVSKSSVLRKTQPTKTRPHTGPKRTLAPQERAPLARPPPPQPKPIAKPSASLQAKLIAKRKARKERLQRQRRGSYNNREEDDEEGYDSGDLSDDFIVHDEEEQGYNDAEDEEQGYDREEIWKMFNRGKSRRDYDRYDDDSSDMEANGADIEREEMLAAKRAREEDLREQEREKRHQEEKKRRLKR